jgi:hypothetical protein
MESGTKHDGTTRPCWQDAGRRANEPSLRSADLRTLRGRSVHGR